MTWPEASAGVIQLTTCYCIASRREPLWRATACVSMLATAACLHVLCERMIAGTRDEAEFGMRKHQWRTNATLVTPSQQTSPSLVVRCTTSCTLQSHSVLECHTASTPTRSDTCSSPHVDHHQGELMNDAHRLEGHTGTTAQLLSTLREGCTPRTSIIYCSRLTARSSTMQ